MQFTACCFHRPSPLLLISPAGRVIDRPGFPRVPMVRGSSERLSNTGEVAKPLSGSSGTVPRPPAQHPALSHGLASQTAPLTEFQTLVSGSVETLLGVCRAAQPQNHAPCSRRPGHVLCTPAHPQELRPRGQQGPCYPDWSPGSPSPYLHSESSTGPWRRLTKCCARVQHSLAHSRCLASNGSWHSAKRPGQNLCSATRI